MAPNDYPHITLMIGRDERGVRTTCELNALGIGLGIFQAWMYMAIFGVESVFDPSSASGYIAQLPVELSQVILYSFLAISAFSLFFIGITNQRYLHFYVSKTAMWIGAGLCCLGTLTIFGSCMTGNTGPLTEFGSVAPPPLSGIAIFCAIISGVLMGTGSSLLVSLWGTGFSRCKFSTIVLNAAFAMAIGMVIALLLIIWIPAPFSGFVTAFLPLLAIVFLWSLTPLPFYERREEPIFRPLPVKRATYFLVMGVPTVLMGIVLGVLRMICVGEILPSGFITVQLVLGASCAMSIIVFICAIAISRNGPYWDTLFRSIVPIVVIGAVFLPMISGELQVVASFFVALGYLCLEVLLWVFFADLASRFRLSPLFVFGIGRGLVEIAAIAGSILALSFYDTTLDSLGNMAMLALVCAAIMSVGYSTLPRYRELKNIVLLDNTTDFNVISDARPKDDMEPKASDLRRAVYIGEDIDESAHSASDLNNTIAAPVQLSNNSTPEFPSLTANDPINETINVNKEAGPPLHNSEPMLAVDGIANHTNLTESNVDTTDASKAAHVKQGTDVASSDFASSNEKGETEKEKEKGSFIRRCEEISGIYMLSRREKEVLLLLAKGHNAAFIQDKLCVSKSTAKTHINHIYKKLDIHTQQELLNMVEERPRRNTNSIDDIAPVGASYMADKDALRAAVESATANAPAGRPKPKRNYTTSIFK